MHLENQILQPQHTVREKFLICHKEIGPKFAVKFAHAAKIPLPIAEFWLIEQNLPYNPTETMAHYLEENTRRKGA